jgi:hypothetical protein
MSPHKARPEIPMHETRPAALTAIENFRVAALRRHFDFLPSRELPGLAMTALEAGLESDSLLELASELIPSWGESGPLFDQILCEFEIEPFSHPAALRALGRYYAGQILSGALAPYDGASRIWREVAQAEEGYGEIWQSHFSFVRTAIEWDDCPDRRVEFESEIREAARKLLAG